MIRTGILILSSFALLAVVAARPARAYSPIAYREVAELRGKQVYAAANVEIARDKAWVFAGEPVTLGKCDKTTSTIHIDKTTTVFGWAYVRCEITTSDHRAGTIKFDDLSRTPLKFNLHEPGTAAALRRAAFDEAFDTVLAMVKFAKAHQAEMAPYRITSNLEGGDVLGEYDSQWHAMAAAWQVAQSVHDGLVNGTHYTTDSVMREPRFNWVVKATDPDMLRIWAKGVENPAEHKRLEAGSNCLTKLYRIDTWGRTPLDVANELAAKEWRHGVKDASPAQLEALDKEYEGKLNKRIADSDASFRKQLQQAEAMRKKLTW